MFRTHALSFLLAATALLLPQGAHAWVHDGNPTMNIRVDRGTHDLAAADVHVEKVRVHTCGGGSTDYQVGQTVDLVQGLDLTINGGDICGVSVMWGNDLLIDHSAWLASYENNYTSVQVVDDSEASAPLLNLEILEGSFTGDTPLLVVNID